MYWVNHGYYIVIYNINKKLQRANRDIILLYRRKSSLKGITINQLCEDVGVEYILRLKIVCW